MKVFAADLQTRLTADSTAFTRKELDDNLIRCSYRIRSAERSWSSEKV